MANASRHTRPTLLATILVARPRRPRAPLRTAPRPQRGSNSRLGAVTRAAGGWPRGAGIDGKCESSHEADCCCNDSHPSSKEAEALRRSLDRLVDDGFRFDLEQNFG